MKDTEEKQNRLGFLRNILLSIPMTMFVFVRICTKLTLRWERQLNLELIELISVSSMCLFFFLHNNLALLLLLYVNNNNNTKTYIYWSRMLSISADQPQHVKQINRWSCKQITIVVALITLKLRLIHCILLRTHLHCFIDVYSCCWCCCFHRYQLQSSSVLWLKLFYFILIFSLFVYVLLQPMSLLSFFCIFVVVVSSFQFERNS